MARKVGFVSEDDHREHERNRRDKDRGTAPKVVVCPPSSTRGVGANLNESAKKGCRPLQPFLARKVGFEPTLRF